MDKRKTQSLPLRVLASPVPNYLISIEWCSISILWGSKLVEDT